MEGGWGAGLWLLWAASIFGLGCSSSCPLTETRLHAVGPVEAISYAAHMYCAASVRSFPPVQIN